jgi:hypothetical protein
MTLDRQRFVDDGRALVAQGVAFRHQGVDPATGMDCVNLPRYLCGLQGISLPDELNNAMQVYSEQPDGKLMLELLRRWFIEIPVVDNKVPDAQLGDLLVLYVFRNPKHMAIASVLPEPEKPMKIIEAWRSPDKLTGKLHETPLDFRRRIAACFRIPDAP